ncbi:transposable element Tcb2 transposase [Nephila pilipes]|uniref:Transposable element Tcb2 transposase n=1 Tax=Nephila pilipes TaxID=299642 RepID=A0A8X6PRW4_NEPPI|nr:transposable element Tcb2 transposase [Nephila pilipes]
MSQRRHLTDSEAWRIVERLEEGKIQAVVEATGVAQSGISRIWNSFLETGSAGRRPGQGRRRATTPNEDIYLTLTARRHRNMNGTLLQQHLRSATGSTISTQTVRNRLHAVGLYAHRPMTFDRKYVGELRSLSFGPSPANCYSFLPFLISYQTTSLYSHNRILQRALYRQASDNRLIGPILSA